MPGLDLYARDVLRPVVEASFHRPTPQSKIAIDAARKEATATTVQAAAVRTLLADGDVLRLTQPGAMLAAENQLRRLLAVAWEDLGDDIQKMLITAEYFGDQVPRGYDHSGPVLGLCAACERLIIDRLFVPSRSCVGDEYRRVTFGEAAATLRRLPRARSGKIEALRRWTSSQPGADLDALARCGKAMLGVNRWRVSAAHSVLVDKETWDKTHTMVLDRQGGLLVQLSGALPGVCL
jgi:hypothetical protein